MILALLRGPPDRALRVTWGGVRTAPPRAPAVARQGWEEAVPAALGLAAAAAFAVSRRGLSEEEKFEEKRLERLEERRKRAFLEPRKGPWTAEELRRYDGSRDEDGPILLACAGLVFNVWKGAHFYAPGCAYHTLAGRDATRLLAKNSLEVRRSIFKSFSPQ
eukprot:s2160_g3.t1